MRDRIWIVDGKACRNLVSQRFHYGVRSKDKNHVYAFPEKMQMLSGEAEKDNIMRCNFQLLQADSLRFPVIPDIYQGDFGKIQQFFRIKDVCCYGFSAIENPDITVFRVVTHGRPPNFNTIFRQD